MADGLISVRRREDDAKTTTKGAKKKSYRRTGQSFHSSTVDVVVPHKGKDVAGKYDICLRKFQYSKALDCVLVSFVVNKTPQVTIALFQELTRRRGLNQALAGRDDKSLVNILKFIIKHIGTPKYGRVLIHVANVLMGNFYLFTRILNCFY